jgi:uncharacterized protein (DUF1697 family)
MTRYVAFLRAINVGGNNMIAMKDLTAWLEAVGLKNIKTFLASGNVAFDAAGTEGALAKKIAGEIKKKCGLTIEVIVRSAEDLAALLASKPFASKKPGADSKLYVAFIQAAPSKKGKIPMMYEKEGIEVFDAKGRRLELYLISRPVNGKYGMPYVNIERDLDVVATMRNWNTIKKIVGTGDGLHVRK